MVNAQLFKLQSKTVELFLDSREMYLNVARVLKQLKIDFIIFCIYSISVSGIGKNILK